MDGSKVTNYVLVVAHVASFSLAEMQYCRVRTCLQGKYGTLTASSSASLKHALHSIRLLVWPRKRPKSVRYQGAILETLSLLLSLGNGIVKELIGTLSSRGEI